MINSITSCLPINIVRNNTSQLNNLLKSFGINNNKITSVSNLNEIALQEKLFEQINLIHNVVNNSKLARYKNGLKIKTRELLMKIVFNKLNSTEIEYSQINILVENLYYIAKYKCCIKSLVKFTYEINVILNALSINDKAPQEINYSDIENSIVTLDAQDYLAEQFINFINNEKNITKNIKFINSHGYYNSKIQDLCSKITDASISNIYFEVNFNCKLNILVYIDLEKDTLASISQLSNMQTITLKNFRIILDDLEILNSLTNLDAVILENCTISIQKNRKKLKFKIEHKSSTYLYYNFF